MTRLTGLLASLLLALAFAPAAFAQDAVAPWREGDRVVGAMEAPVTLTVYVSTTCGHCARWHVVDFPAFKAKYVDTGQVRVVFRELPTPPQEIAIAGAVMARCVPADRYDDALTSLYSEQGLISPRRPEPENERVAKWLSDAGAAGGLTVDEMRACFQDDANWHAVAERIDQSVADGVDGTPSFFVNGARAMAEATSLDVAAFDAVIQPLLAGH